MAVLTSRALFFVFLIISLVDVTGAAAALHHASPVSILLLAAVAWDVAVLHRLWKGAGYIRTEAG